MTRHLGLWSALLSLTAFTFLAVAVQAHPDGGKAKGSKSGKHSEHQCQECQKGQCRHHGDKDHEHGPGFARGPRGGGHGHGHGGPGRMRGRGMMGRGMRGRGGRMGPGMMGRGMMGRGMMNDPTFMADRNDFHYLLSNYKKIRRRVKMLPNGVETWTETNDPRLVPVLQRHVESMHRRIKEKRPIRMMDPLFAEIFRHTDQIEMKIQRTPKGVHVIETSPDPYVVQLIQAHARVVSGFVKRGFAEAHRLHPAPKRKVAQQKR